MFARRASLRANAISKNLFSFCLFSCLLFKIAMHCFRVQRASAQKYARPRWLFKKFALYHHSPFIHYCFFGGGKVWRVGAGKSAPAFMECCIKIASPRAAAPRDIPAAALDKKVLHFNQLSFRIVQF